MQTFKLSFFKHKRDTVPQMVERSWEQLCEQFRQPQIRAAKDGLLFAPAVFDHAKRSKENVREVSMLTLDIDKNAPELKTLITQVATLNSAYVIHSTHSHLRRTETNPDAEKRFRVVVPLACPIPAKDFQALWQYAKQKTGLPLDESAKDESRMFYAPAIAAKDAPYVFDMKNGEFLNWTDLPLDSFAANGHINANANTKRETLVFEFHEDRHAELCRRIEAQAKNTGRGTYEMKCPSHNGKGDSSLFYALDSKSVKCLKGCNYFDILAAFNLPNGKLPSRENAEKTKTEFEATETKIKPFPVPNEKCFHGLAGDFVRLVEPHTEASAMALLVQFLAYFGNIIGRTAFYQVEGDKHFTNLFIVLVGNTAQGRKGTSYGRVRQVYKGLDADHEKNCLASGLASGEGLLYRIRDAQYIQKKNKETSELEEILTDGGVSDKRLLVVESEFVQVLRVQGRDGNILSSTIRTLWDTGNAESVTKNSPLKTTDAHVSIVGHITQNEYRETLSEGEMANGYANRLANFVVARARFLPFGSEVPARELGRLQDRISDAIDFAKQKGQMNFSIEASRLWASSYERLETSRFGFLAKITQRASPYVLRFSLIFALLDKSPLIEKAHLEAALSVWQYSEDSARYIFGERLDNQTAERILTALKENQEKGLTRTEIRDLFDRHISNEKLNAALSLLLENGLAEPKKEETKGRAKEIWFPCVISVISVLSSETDSTDEPFNAFNAYNAETALETEERETAPHFPNTNEKAAGDSYACQFCPARIPLILDDCPDCGKRQIEF
jgi:Ca2+-binding EF-hand superfamily protein